MLAYHDCMEDDIASAKPSPIPEDTSFVKWCLINFTTREHFVRFLASTILLITVLYITREKQIPDGWWGVFGMVMGYYFRGHSEPETKARA